MPSTLCSFLKIRVNSLTTCLFRSSCMSRPFLSRGPVQRPGSPLHEYSGTVLRLRVSPDPFLVADFRKIGGEFLCDRAPTRFVSLSQIRICETFVGDDQFAFVTMGDKFHS